MCECINHFLWCYTLIFSVQNIWCEELRIFIFILKQSSGIVSIDRVPFIGMVCSNQDMVLLIKLKLIPIFLSSVLPRMMSYRHCSEVKTSACKFPIPLFANSGNLMLDMITFSLVLNVPFVVVVLLGGPCRGTTP